MDAPLCEVVPELQADAVSTGALPVAAKGAADILLVVASCLRPSVEALAKSDKPASHREVKLSGRELCATHFLSRLHDQSEQCEFADVNRIA